MTSTFSVMKNPMMLVLYTRGMLVELASFSLSSKIKGAAETIRIRTGQTKLQNGSEKHNS